MTEALASFQLKPQSYSSQVLGVGVQRWLPRTDRPESIEGHPDNGIALLTAESEEVLSTGT